MTHGNSSDSVTRGTRLWNGAVRLARRNNCNYLFDKKIDQNDFKKSFYLFSLFWNSNFHQIEQLKKYTSKAN